MNWWNGESDVEGSMYELINQQMDPRLRKEER